jgi:tRNA G18 (ribose-2'-O)-methylase SpoU
MRRLVREGCDILARLPMRGGLASLNVAAAAAAASYEALRQRDFMGLTPPLPGGRTVD